MKRVIILSAFISPFRSGAEACAEEVALRLSDRFDITIITAKLRPDLPRQDYLRPNPNLNPNPSPRIIRVGLGCSFDKWLYPFLAPFAARKLRPDVIHAVLESFAGVALHACTMIVPRAKQILTLQTTNRNFLRRHILRTPDVVTAISSVLADQAAKLGRTDVTVIPNGINYAEIRKACDGVLKIPGRILFVGRLEKMKGVDTLLKAIALVSPSPRGAERGPGGEVHIVGDGSLRASLERQAHDLGVTDRVTFTGRLDGPALLREYAEADIFCGLSRSEAMGNVFLEAQAAGCAVLATEIGGIPEIIRDGYSGILTEPDNPELTADVLTKFLTDDKWRRKFQAEAISWAKGFDWDGIAEKYAELY